MATRKAAPAAPAPAAPAPAAPAPAPGPAPVDPTAAQLSPSIEDLIAAIVAASAAPSARRSGPAGDPWAGLSAPLTDKERDAVHWLADAAKRTGAAATAWTCYRDSRDWLTPKAGSAPKLQTTVNLLNCADHTKRGYLFNGCVIAVLQKEGQIKFGSFAVLAKKFGIIVKSQAMAANRIMQVINVPIKWEEGFLRVDTKLAALLPADPMQDVNLKLAQGIINA